MRKSIMKGHHKLDATTCNYIEVKTYLKYDSNKIQKKKPFLMQYLTKFFFEKIRNPSCFQRVVRLASSVSYASSKLINVWDFYVASSVMLLYVCIKANDLLMNLQMRKIILTAFCCFSFSFCYFVHQQISTSIIKFLICKQVVGITKRSLRNLVY